VTAHHAFHYVRRSKEIQPWSVILIGDDKAKQVRVEGYGSSIDKPAIVKTVKFPPG
jgi:hypothetical protein